MIFLSHSWTNKPVARRIVEALALQGLPSWLDEQQLALGAGLRAALLKAIANAKVYLYLTSPAANESSWVQDELGYALERELEQKLRIVPVRLADDATELPPLLSGRLFHSLSVAEGGGVTRLAHTIKTLIGPDATVPEGSRISATVRLLPTRLNHTLDEARAICGPGATDVLFLEEGYERLDEMYWQVSEQQFPFARGPQQKLEAAAGFIDAVHKRSRMIINEVQGIANRYLLVSPTSDHRLYFEAGLQRALRVLLHRLAWNTTYLRHLRDSAQLEQDFVDKRELPNPFDGHVCQFAIGNELVGSAEVPSHGHPFASRKPPGPWGMTSPFDDMMDADVGTAVGNVVALRVLAGSLPSFDLPDPEALRYGLA